MDATSKHRFWSALKKRMEEKKSPVRARKPNSENSMEFGIGRSSFYLGGWLQSTNTESWIGVYLRIGAPHAAAHFELLQQQRGEIEQELGKLEWQPPVPNRREEPLIQLLDTNGVVPFVVELRVANSRSPLRSHLCYATSATTPSGGASASRAPTRCCRSR